MSRAVTINHSVTFTDSYTVKLHIWLTATDVTNKLFAILYLPSTATGLTRYRFSHVVSPSLLELFPLDTPGDSAYFRTHDIEMIFDAVCFVLPTLTHIRKDIKKLLRLLDALDTEATTTGSTTVSMDSDKKYIFVSADTTLANNNYAVVTANCTVTLPLCHIDHVVDVTTVADVTSAQIAPKSGLRIYTNSTTYTTLGVIIDKPYGHFSFVGCVDGWHIVDAHR